MTNNIKLSIAYDGSEYYGWQRQAKECTIQEVLENTLSIICKEKIIVHGSGRTDARVHALGQVANFKTDLDLPPLTWQKALNSMLPDAIVIKQAEIADNDFHARYAARKKHYQYRIIATSCRNPFEFKYAWQIERPLNIDKMKKAAEVLLGEHDFSSFQASGSEVKTSIRTLSQIEIEQNGVVIQIDMTANGFLRHMVRNIVGTLVEIGYNKIPPEGMIKILEARDRSQAGPTAPPQGLYLMEVKY